MNPDGQIDHSVSDETGGRRTSPSMSWTRCGNSFGPGHGKMPGIRWKHG